MKPVILMLSTKLFLEGVQAWVRRNDKSTKQFQLSNKMHISKRNPLLYVLHLLVEKMILPKN